MARPGRPALLVPAILALLAVSAGGPLKAAAPTVTYSRDIAPIFQQYCQDCHHIGGVAPFPLLTYRDARVWAEVIHHVSLYLDTTGASQALQRAAAPGPGFPVTGGGAGFSPATWLADWGPGTGPLVLPAGTAWRIPAHARLVVQVHYHQHEHEHRLPVPDSHPLADRT